MVGSLCSSSSGSSSGTHGEPPGIGVAMLVIPLSSLGVDIVSTTPECVSSTVSTISPSLSSFSSLGSASSSVLLPSNASYSSTQQTLGNSSSLGDRDIITAFSSSVLVDDAVSPFLLLLLTSTTAVMARTAMSMDTNIHIPIDFFLDVEV